MVALCLAIRLQQVAIKAVAHAVRPLAQVGIRSLFALVLVAGIGRCCDVALWVPEQFGPGLIIGSGYTLEFAFVRSA